MDRTQRTAVRIPAEGVILDGDLGLPREASGVVAFAHGSGSSRKSPRNQRVAAGLERAGLATLLLDLLTPEEEAIDLRTRHLRFDIGLLSRRMIAAVDWLGTRRDTRDLDVGLFGSSTGAAAAIVAAAERPQRVSAVVSRGGRPDLAGGVLARSPPTLLVVGGEDRHVLELNRDALRVLGANGRLLTVPGATHLFEEPGALDAVIDAARAWFADRLAPLAT